jgi:hypothetical protein
MSLTLPTRSLSRCHVLVHDHENIAAGAATLWQVASQLDLRPI